MSSALPKHIHSTGDLPKVAWAKGAYVHDVDGKQYIDGSGGPAVYCIGHSNTEVNDAIKDQLDRIAHGYRYNFSSDAMEELTEIIRRRCGGTLNNMVYVTGGSEAVESCLKLALQCAIFTVWTMQHREDYVNYSKRGALAQGVGCKKFA